ncbi:purine biosynthesis protein PurH [Clostridium sp. BJN0001]|uniref:purine biosynthesis protein PurH n=1 Tax=Clostridium sp. BJN0001 TaxID=2930219 RepID=UPI001FD4AEAA|nr:purine biosynthesis protein PurH [Clostridium sp. BJN0001]
MDEYLIKNTTKQQREEIVKKSLGYSDIGCEECVDGYDMYQPYIDGKMELSEISASYRTNYVEESPDSFQRGGCSGK